MHIVEKNYSIDILQRVYYLIIVWCRFRNLYALNTNSNFLIDSLLNIKQRKRTTTLMGIKARPCDPQLLLDPLLAWPQVIHSPTKPDVLRLDLSNAWNPAISIFVILIYLIYNFLKLQFNLRIIYDNFIKQRD